MKFDKMKKILCPIDFSENSIQATRYAGYIGNFFGADLTLAHVLLPYPANIVNQPVSGSAAMKMAGSAEREDVALDRLRTVADDHLASVGNVDCKVLNGSIVDSVLRLANEEKADLIVMGTSSTDNFLTRLLGSNAYGVVKEAHCPVITCREEFNLSAPLGRVLIPIDREFGVRELRWFQSKHLKDYAVTFTLLHIVKPGTSGDELADINAFMLKEKEAFTRDGAIIANTVVLEGRDIPATIIDYAKRHDQDLIMLNSHGMRGIGQVIVGSNTSKVLHNSPVPVLTMRPDRPKATARHYYHSWFPV